MPIVASTNAKALIAPCHYPLLTVDVKFHVPWTKSMISVKALIDSGASAPVISPKLAERLGCQPRKCYIRMTQANGTKLVSCRMISTKLCMRNREFQLDAAVLNLGERQLVIGLSWLRENGFILDPVKRTLEKAGCVVQCSELNLLKVTFVELTSARPLTLEIEE